MELQNWLRTALQHYSDPERTFRDVDAVLQMYVSLRPKMDNYTYNDGHTELLLCLYGTVPITYRSVPYNIPVAFWIPMSYPHQPPIPYVKPTANMLVREGNYVDNSGLCYHPYRSSWTEDVNKHTLLELIAVLQQVFGQEPPVYTKIMPPNTIPSSPPSSHHATPPISKRSSLNTMPLASPSPPPVSTTSTTAADATAAGSKWYGDGTAFYNIHQGFASMSLNPTGPNPTASSSTGSIPKSSSFPVMPTASDYATRGRSAVHDKLYRKVLENMQSFNMTISAEMDRLLMVNRQLNDGEMAINHEEKMLLDARQKLEYNINLLKTRSKDIEETTDKVNNIPDIEVDEALSGTTVVYNQLFELVADDCAISDTMYILGKALNTERIDLATFMKCTRALAREQFMKRALIKKICDADK
ncbi:UEV domain-containing protein [Radiomyces spectabilis]|uniref:UEV domain-containing protein n=1 Tax=Radiomyces spectabilis TaxID=64574 RepID=UPI00221FAAE9|nr:UEV domain-containing protein [Radiomyces spectabilis]KAI8371583.1 UEV domain-containing protein [Radiomyces spectabilis]